jgi:hypothetical protein
LRDANDRLSAQPWWSAADVAELDLLAFDLAHAVREHQASRSVCLAGHPPCPDVGEAIAAALEWRDRRDRTSRAAWLRAREWMHELEVEHELAARAEWLELQETA